MIDTKRLRHLGIVLGKGESSRLHQKNQQFVMGKPLIEHSANTLRYSGMFEKIVFSTDSKELIRLAAKVPSIDECHMRDPESDESTRITSAPQHVVRRLVEERGERPYDSVTCIHANVLFIRPSWVRVAYDILYNYDYLNSKISMVAFMHHHVTVYRFYPYGDLEPNVYELWHSGIVVDIDHKWDLKLAREIGEQVEAGTISLPYDEDIHERVFSVADANNMRGLQQSDKYHVI